MENKIPALDLPDLGEATPEEQILAENVKALGPIYLSSMLEELRVFAVLDKLVEQFQNGKLPLGRGSGGKKLYKYWKDDRNRISATERRDIYARSIGHSANDESNPANRAFNDLWLRFLANVSSLVHSDSTANEATAQENVRTAARELASNMSRHGAGWANFVSRELQSQINEVISVLSDADISSAFGARDMWQVIDQVNDLELGGRKNITRYRTMASTGTTIINWLARNSRRLSATATGSLLDLSKINSKRPTTRATTSPSDSDLVSACEQWLAVNSVPDDTATGFADPK